MGCSPQGFSVRGILQARILKWVTMPSSRVFSWPMSPALAGVFFTTQPPRKPLIWLRKWQKEVLILVLASCLLTCDSTSLQDLLFCFFPLWEHDCGQIWSWGRDNDNVFVILSYAGKFQVLKSCLFPIRLTRSALIPQPFISSFDLIHLIDWKMFIQLLPNLKWCVLLWVTVVSTDVLMEPSF